MFRRKKADEPVAPDEATAEVQAPAGPRSRGPWDVSEVTVDEDGGDRIDLGSLLVTPHEGLDLQLQVDEASGQVIAGEVARMGGTATEVEGPWGTEVKVSLTVTRDDGQRVQQASKVVGIPGPRWLLRATLFGRPAVEYDEAGDVETALRDVVVVRGGSPVPPGDALPLTMPPNARRTDTEA